MTTKFIPAPDELTRAALIAVAAALLTALIVPRVQRWMDERWPTQSTGGSST